MTEWHGRDRKPTKEEIADFEIRQVPYHIVLKKLGEKTREKVMEMVNRYSREKVEGRNPDPLEYRRVIYELSGIDKYLEAYR